MNDHNNNKAAPTADQARDSLVTESLLSLAKDARYVRSIQQLLEEAAEPLLSNSLVPSVLKKGTWYASYLFYVLMFVGRHGRTLGMKVTGIQFSTDNYCSKRRLTLALASLGVSALVADLWASKENLQQESQSDGLRGSDRQRRHELLRQQMLQRATSSQWALQYPNLYSHRRSRLFSYSHRWSKGLTKSVKVRENIILLPRCTRACDSD